MTKAVGKASVLSLWIGCRLSIIVPDSRLSPVPEDAPYSSYGRRKSVFAEAYNPEDDEVEEKAVSQVYPSRHCKYT